MNARRFSILFLCLCATVASARDPDGTLGLIQAPNNGVPALTTAGGSFEAILGAETELWIVRGDERIALETQWQDGRTATCILPSDTPPGVYAIAAEEDRTERAVYVLDASPSYYAIAHVSDTHLGKDGRHPRPSDAINLDVFAAVNETDAVFAVVTGDLTEGATPGEFRRFLAVLDTCALPTFVQPGNHDRAGANYEAFFGPLTYRFRFGEDGYLAFDTKDFRVADELGEQDGLLERWRRELKSCRWTIGLTHRYEPMMGMRSQLVLFVDNPLDMILVGHWHRENTPEEAMLPWGATRLSAVPAAIDGRFRLLDMTAQGLKPRAVQQIDRP